MVSGLLFGLLNDFFRSRFLFFLVSRLGSLVIGSFSLFLLSFLGEFLLLFHGLSGLFFLGLGGAFFGGSGFGLLLGRLLFLLVLSLSSGSVSLLRCLTLRFLFLPGFAVLFVGLLRIDILLLFVLSLSCLDLFALRSLLYDYLFFLCLLGPVLLPFLRLLEVFLLLGFLGHLSADLASFAGLLSFSHSPVPLELLDTLVLVFLLVLAQVVLDLVLVELVINTDQRDLSPLRKGETRRVNLR
jgi:hypothetical protein